MADPVSSTTNRGAGAQITAQAGAWASAWARTKSSPAAAIVAEIGSLGRDRHALAVDVEREVQVHGDAVADAGHGETDAGHRDVGPHSLELANLIAEVNEHRRTNVEAVETITKLTAALEVLP